MLTSSLFDPAPTEETTIACDPSVIDDPERHKKVAERLFEERQELSEVDGGMAIRFPRALEYAERILNFVSGERQCCPFLTFEIIFEPEERDLWLLIGGDENAKIVKPVPSEPRRNAAAPESPPLLKI